MLVLTDVRNRLVSRLENPTDEGEPTGSPRPELLLAHLGP